DLAMGGPEGFCRLVEAHRAVRQRGGKHLCIDETTRPKFLGIAFICGDTGKLDQSGTTVQGLDPQTRSESVLALCILARPDDEGEASLEAATGRRPIDCQAGEIKRQVVPDDRSPQPIDVMKEPVTEFVDREQGNPSLVLDLLEQLKLLWIDAVIEETLL